MDKPTLVIGDVHGDLACLKALLEQEGVLSDPNASTVIQLGDLGHFGAYPKSSRGADRETYHWVVEHSEIVDGVLWGNHDWAVDHYPAMGFFGYEAPFYETWDDLKALRKQERIHLALAAHGFLFTHAGLHAAFQYNHVDAAAKDSPQGFVDWVRACSETPNPPKDFVAIRDAIPVARGGPATAGGILWRDSSEKLYGNFRQVFGHSRGDKVRRYHGKAGTSYCIDVHSPTNERLAGIWLPDEQIVEVQI